jgi:DNA repair protein RadC
VEGIGKIKAVQIMAMLEFSKRVAKQQAVKEFKISSPASIAKIYMQEMRYLKQEHFKVVYFDIKNNILGDRDITIGTINTTIVHPREVFSEAVKMSAASVIVLHNHPSGDAQPSKEDIQVTKRLSEAGKILGIDLLDHIVIGDGQYISLKEKGFI